MAHKPKTVSVSFARKIGDELGVDWSAVDIEEFRRGLEVEQEHWNTVKGNWYQVAKIALDHLAEYADYYTRLDKMEVEAERYWRRR